MNANDAADESAAVGGHDSMRHGPTVTHVALATKETWAQIGPSFTHGSIHECTHKDAKAKSARYGMTSGLNLDMW